MARGRKRIRREQQAAGRPSLFFIITLTLAVLALLFVFIQTLRHPVKQEPPRKTTEFAVRGSQFAASS